MPRPSARWKPLNPGAVDLCNSVPHPNAADFVFRENFEQRQQHESTFEHAWVWQRQSGRVQDHIAIRQNVDIDRPRTPANFLVAIAAERLLDLPGAIEQL